MPDYLYLVLNKDGERMSGELEAPSREKVVALLQKKGLTPLTVDEVKPKHWIWHIFQPVKPQLLALWIRQISVMQRSGIPISRALVALQPQTGPQRFKKSMARVMQDVQNGFSLSQAMMRAPEFFSRFMIGSTRIGEASGRLADTLERCAEHYEKEYTYTLKLRQALVYPTVLLSASGGLVFFIFTFMIPKFIGLFVDMKLELPWATKLLVDSAHFIETYGMVVFFSVIGPASILFYVYYYWSRTRRGKATLERALLRVPWYGQQVRYRMMAAYFRSFATLIDSGVSVYASLNLLAKSVDKELLRRTALTQIEAVRTGKQLVAGLNKEKLFPKMCTEMIVVGEETGTLDQMCYRLADFFDAEMTRGLDLIGKLVEPVVLLILGAGVAVVLLAAFMPIYQLASSF